MIQELIEGTISILILLFITAGPLIAFFYFLARKRTSKPAGRVERHIRSLTDAFVPMLRPTSAQMDEHVDVLRSECDRLKQENEELKRHVQQLIESGKHDQARVRASFPKPDGELDKEDDG